MQPLFSVIVVSYNAGTKLNATIRNILEQSCQDLEILWKDACSQDGSPGTLWKELLPEEKAKILRISGKDRGIYDGMNEALLQAKGKYIYFLNCGDLLHDRDVLQKVKKKILSVSPEKSRQIWYGDVLEKSSGQIVAANPRMTHFAMYRYLP